MTATRTRPTFRPALEGLEDRTVPTVVFRFDYSLDSSGFFANSTRRDLLEAAGRTLADRLDDRLAAIAPSGSDTWAPYVTHPATGARKNLSGSLSVPADTIVVYAGGRDLPTGTLAEGGGGGYSARGSQAWLDTVKGRGQSGALKADGQQTDVAPAVSAITFDTVGTAWHFGATTAGLDRNESDFVSVAAHELAHVLGMGTAGSWQRLAKGSTFAGAEAARVYGRNVPLDGGKGHWKDGTLSDGTEAAMDPSLTAGTRKLFSKLDFAGLKDIGWQVNANDDTLSTAATQLDLLSNGSGGLGGTAAVAFTGRIDAGREVDIYRVLAGAGTTLKVTVGKKTGGTILDTYIRLFDGSGLELVKADQGGVGGTDTLTFKVTRTDYYYVGVSSFGNRAYNPKAANSGPGGATGDYRIVLELS